MIASLAATLGLAGLVIAAPAVDTGSVPRTSRGFNLILNVTDPSRDFNPSIHGTYVTSIHIGAARNQLGQSPDCRHGRIFYVNGTEEEAHHGMTNVISDAGSPVFPEAISFDGDPKVDQVSTVFLNAGSGNQSVGITRFPNPVAELFPNNWAACWEATGRDFVVLKRINQLIDQSGQIKEDTPQGCVPVTLIPQCAFLGDVPSGSISSHEYAVISRCYTYFGAINWRTMLPH